jgi:hypothetical protein
VKKKPGSRKTREKKGGGRRRGGGDAFAAGEKQLGSCAAEKMKYAALCN